MNSLVHVNSQIKWSDNDKSENLEVEADGLIVNCKANTIYKDQSKSFVASAIRTNKPIPQKCESFYFEITIKDKGKNGIIGIGFCTETVKSFDRMPGFEKNSWGYRSDNGNVFSCSGSGEQYGPSFTVGDIIGCCLNFRNNTAFFTKNGVHLGIAFRELKIEEELYPCIGLKSEEGSLEANFRQHKFKYEAMNDDDINDIFLREVWNRALYECNGQQKIDDFESLKKLSENEINFYQYQAKACFILGRYNEALEYLATLLNIDQNDLFALKYRVEIYYLMKEYRESLDNLAKLLKIKQNNMWAIEVRQQINMKRRMEWVSNCVL